MNNLLPIETPKQRLEIYKQVLTQVENGSEFLCFLLPMTMGYHLFDCWSYTNTPKEFPELKKYLDFDVNKNTGDIITKTGLFGNLYIQDRVLWRKLVLKDIIKELETNN